MSTVRLVAAGAATVLLGAAIGFLVSLLRPRRYADFSGARVVTPVSPPPVR